MGKMNASYKIMFEK